MNEELRDQMIGLSWAAAITGLLVSLVEWLILPADVFLRIAPYTFGTLALGAFGLWWFRFRKSTTGAPVETPTIPGGDES